MSGGDQERSNYARRTGRRPVRPGTNWDQALTIRVSDIMWSDVPAEDDGLRALTRINRRRWIEDVKTAYEGIFVIEDPKAIEVYACEMQIDGMRIDGVPTNGSIHRIRYGVNKRGKEGLARATPIPTPTGRTTLASFPRTGGV